MKPSGCVMAAPVVAAEFFHSVSGAGHWAEKRRKNTTSFEADISLEGNKICGSP